MKDEKQSETGHLASEASDAEAETSNLKPDISASASQSPTSSFSSLIRAARSAPCAISPSSFRSGHAFLKQLLSERIQYPERAAEIDEAIRRAFERRVAILAMDMSGFSRLTLELGIIHYLTMIHQMQQAATPAVTDNGGKVIKYEADNLFAIFTDPASALEGALDIYRAFNAINGVLPHERHIYGSIGIGYGETLVIDEEDMFGAEMNIACKLGEDIAGREQILLTAAAYKALPTGYYFCEVVSFSISNIEGNYYRYERTLREREPGANP